eukprot:CAMPEP_0117663302 /NCGR_PEP_ID=MMETSP0804-20121206/8529_1 /TAXON_ID=1074897 /ORGANISM="Tetraselmis astigmatica, Strain CCMP880" /LENGTH=146 /DNA_ID=CAMNT_0005470289 /DNA_START=96 /DNA_END=536 /DNA_ORIENTATION=-
MASMCTVPPAVVCVRPVARVAAAPSPASARLRPVQHRRRMVAVRAAEGEEAPKESPVAMKATNISDFKDLTAEQIDAEVEAAKLEMYYMRNKQALRKEVKTSNFGVLRKKVAQLLTLKRQMFAEMNKREYRSMERRQLLDAGEFVR